MNTPRKGRSTSGTTRKDAPLPAKQQRSRATTELILNAAESLLESGGAETATLRSIAEGAGMSVGIVYRRFPDKDAVLRAVYIRFYERLGRFNVRGLERARTGSASIEQLGRTLVTSMAEGYRRNHRLLRGLVLYARSHPDPEFRRRTVALNSRTLKSISAMITRLQSGSAHPIAARDARFAVASVAAVLAEAIVFHDVAAMPKQSAPEIARNAERLFLGYLQYDDKAATRW